MKVPTNINQIKEKFKTIEDVIFSEHAENKLKIRKIEKEFIIKNIRNPIKLIKFFREEDRYPGEKYELYFIINKRKSLKIVVSFLNNNLNIITAHIILSKRLKWVKKWRKKRL